MQIEKNKTELKRDINKGSIHDTHVDISCTHTAGDEKYNRCSIQKDQEENIKT